MNVRNCLVSLFIGILSYIPNHYLSGIMGSWVLPKFIKEFMKENGRLGIMAIDIFIISLPMFLTFLLITFVLFTILNKKKLSLFFIFSIGWLIPSTYLLIQINGTINNFIEWPHLPIFHLMPLLGAFVGFLLSKGENDS